MIKKKIILVLILLCLFVPLAMALLTTRYYMSAPVAKESVQLFSDEQCTIAIPTTYTWTETVWNGTILNMWTKNTGNINVNVTLSLASQVNCSITLTPNSFALNINSIQKIEIGFSNVTGTTASWSFDLKADKTP